MIDNPKRLKPLLNYLGSKAGLADQLIRRMPPEVLESRAELFAGSSAVELALPPAKRNAILNDLDADVIGVLEAVASEPKAVKRHLQKLRSSRDTFNRIRDLREQPEWNSLPPAQRAAYMVYLSRESVNANMRSFSLSSKRRSSFNSDVDLTPYAKRYEGVTFTNFDWRELLERLVFKPKAVNIFLFIDPPFVVSDGRKHYRLNFDGVEHVLLARRLARVNALNNGQQRNAKIMISYDDDSGGFIRALYRPEFGWHIDELDVSYDAGNHAKRSELIITNYDPSKLPTTIAAQPRADWSDIPSERLCIGGVPFADLACCDKEYVALLLSAKVSGKCRECGTKLNT